MEDRRAYHRKWYQEHRERHLAQQKHWYSQQSAEYRRDKNLRCYYKMSITEFDALLAAQGGVCAACGTAEPGGKDNQWHVDHDHECCSGKVTCGNCVRSILCQRCNHAVGKMEKNPGAVAYFMKWQQAKV